MDQRKLPALLAQEEEADRRADGLWAMRRLLAAQPERFRLKAEPAAFPPRPRTDRRKKMPEALREAGSSGPFPSRLPWGLLPAPEPKKVRTRVVYQTLPAEDLARLVRSHMKERRITMEEMAAFLHVSPGTFRKWLRVPEEMTVRDYGALAAWVSTPTALSGQRGRRG